MLSLAGRTVLRNAIWGNAVALWGEARDHAPDHWLPHLLLGEALHGAGRDFEAVAEYSESLQRRPDLEFTYRNMGVCLIELQDFDRAKTLFEQLRHRNPRSVTASLGLGAVAAAQGDAVLARRYYLEALGNDAQNISARQSLALLDESEPANPAEALQFCREIRLLAPETPGNDECIERNERLLAVSRTRQ
jgi:Flp pilus assembly protein TadD